MLFRFFPAILLAAGFAAAQSNPSTTNATSTPTSNSTSSTSSSAKTYPTTTDGSCGANGRMCLRNGTSPCCSSNGNCGNTDEYCSKARGCQEAFGLCHANPADLDNPACSWADEGTSPRCDGKCGNAYHGAVCSASARPDAFVAYGVYNYGPCCSTGGFCGSTAAHCSPQQKCQSGCWTNESSTTTSASAASTSSSAAEKLTRGPPGAGAVLLGLGLAVPVGLMLVGL